MEADFSRVRTLQLSALNICTVSNISDFSHLAKLVLSNNAIELITGLKLLNVPFDKPQTLGGLEKLMRLADLVASNN